MRLISQASAARWICQVSPTSRVSWLTVLTPSQFFQQIAGSAEFQMRHRRAGYATFVTNLYEDGLGRAPDAAGGVTIPLC